MFGIFLFTAAAGALPIPGRAGSDMYQPGSTGSDRTTAAGGVAYGSVMPGSMPAAYASVQPGGFMPPTAGALSGSPPTTSVAMGAPRLPSAQVVGGSGGALPSAAYGGYSPPGSYQQQAGSYQAPSSTSLPVGSAHRDAMGSYPIGTLPPGSIQAIGSYAADHLPPGSYSGEPMGSQGSYRAASYPAGQLGSSGQAPQGLGSYPAGQMASRMNVPRTQSTLPGGVAPGTVHGLHSRNPPTGAFPPTAFNGSLPATEFGLHQDSYPGMQDAPGSAYGSAGRLGSAHLPQGNRLGSAGTLSSAGTMHGINYPDAAFVGRDPVGSANSAGTMHDMHPGYAPGIGYAPPTSSGQQLGNQLSSQGQVVGRLEVRIIAAYNLRNTDLGVTAGELSDPFVVIKLGNQEHHTDVVKNNLNPTFNSTQLTFEVPDENDVLKLEVLNASQFYAHDSLGKLSLHLHTIVSCPGEVQSRKDALVDGDHGQIEYELYYVPPERMMAMSSMGRAPPSGQAFPFMELQVQHKPVQHKVPLPDFKGFGPAAFMAPPPEIEKAPVGEMKKKQEYESWACHLGQYDYDRDGPVYFPNQEAPDRHAWQQDPFYRSIEDRSSAEAGGAAENKDPFGKWLKRDGHGQGDPGRCHKCGSVMMSDAKFCRNCGAPREVLRDRQVIEDKASALQLWSKDPFYDWLREDLSHPEGGNEKIQEARRERRMLALPSINDDTKRFEDNREYVQMGDVAQNVRKRYNQKRHHQVLDVEQRWKDDAFFGWLPEHGSRDQEQREEKHMLHRPLENARMHRLPSFSEDRFMGLQGKGVGVLKVWVKYAQNLHYDPGSNLVGRPSACVKLSCGEQKHERFDQTRSWITFRSNEQQALATLGWNQNMWERGSVQPESASRNWEQLSQQEKDALRCLGIAANWDPKLKGSKKLTPTVEHEMSPVWSTGAFQFEVDSLSDVLTLEVIDLLGQDNASNISLGIVKRAISELEQIGRASAQYSPGWEVGGHGDTWKVPAGTGVHEEVLQGVSDRSAKIGFTVAFQPYASAYGGAPQRAHAALPAPHQQQHHPQHQQHQQQQHHQASRAYSGQSFLSTPGVECIGRIQVRQLQAFNLRIHQSGFADMLSKPTVYVMAKLKSQAPRKAQRTESLNPDNANGANGLQWQDPERKDWTFKVEDPNDVLELHVREEHVGSDDVLLGVLNIPCDSAMNLPPGQEVPLRELLRDEHGDQLQAELQVAIVYKPA